jgi:hypothetical protein
MKQPIICFGQQPCGFFPKRFLISKIETATRLKKEIGGKVVFFYHDSDADYRETITIMNDRQSGAEVRLNFTQENKLQKKFSPLYAKRIPAGWKEDILKQLPRFVDKNLQDLFNSIEAATVADFCLKMYGGMGLLDGVEIYRSSDKNFRQQASELTGEYFIDILYHNELVRAQLLEGKLKLHEGGGLYSEVPMPANTEKWQKNPGRDQRFAWMQSVINATHYIYGEGEKEYLKAADFPEIHFLDRDKIDNSNFAWLGKYL